MIHDVITILWFLRISNTSICIVATADGCQGCLLHFVALIRIFLEKLWHKIPFIAVLQSVWHFFGALYHKLWTQSCSPEDGRNYRPKYVELIEITNKLLLLHLVDCLYYCISDARSHKYQIYTLVTTETTFSINWAVFLVYLYFFLTKRASYFCFSSLCLDEQSVYAYPVLQLTSTPTSCSTFNDADSNAAWKHSIETLDDSKQQFIWNDVKGIWTSPT